LTLKIRDLLELGLVPRSPQDAFNIAMDGRPLTLRNNAALQGDTIYRLHKATQEELAAVYHVLDPTPTPAALAAHHAKMDAGRYDEPQHHDGMVQGLIGALWFKVFSDKDI